ncbi:MAG: hypothetical protein OXF02_04080 [Simkaniaceae bacterium]|nr:hypothetical protein [Simkaniaceae bacterium]
MSYICCCRSRTGEYTPSAALEKPPRVGSVTLVESAKIAQRKRSETFSGVSAKDDAVFSEEELAGLRSAIRVTALNPLPEEGSEVVADTDGPLAVPGRETSPAGRPTSTSCTTRDVSTGVETVETGRPPTPSHNTTRRPEH